MEPSTSSSPTPALETASTAVDLAEMSAEEMWKLLHPPEYGWQRCGKDCSSFVGCSARFPADSEKASLISGWNPVLPYPLWRVVCRDGHTRDVVAEVASSCVRACGNARMDGKEQEKLLKRAIRSGPAFLQACQISCDDARYKEASCRYMTRPTAQGNRPCLQEERRIARASERANRATDLRRPFMAVGDARARVHRKIHTVLQPEPPLSRNSAQQHAALSPTVSPLLSTVPDPALDSTLRDGWVLAYAPPGSPLAAHRPQPTRAAPSGVPTQSRIPYRTPYSRGCVRGR
jgi:hypothetical protein